MAKAKLVKSPPGNPIIYTLDNVQTVVRVEPGIVGMKYYGSRVLFDRETYLFVSLAERLFSPYRDHVLALIEN